ncbi:MAG: tetratricopeptide repeat protein [Candidatus Schekmanbacteria bacterium]|nr:tetratricopeptide repeat protein [Candidatus Schekmanbacteria bacterium]
MGRGSWRTSLLRIATPLLYAAAVALPATSVARAAVDEQLARGLYDNAVSLLKAGKPEPALADFAKVYTSFADSELADDALFAVGQYHFDAGHLVDARAAFQAIIDRYVTKPAAPGAYYFRAVVATVPTFSGFDLDDAYADFLRVARLYPESEWVDQALLGAGKVSLRLGELGEAARLMETLLAASPEADLSARARLVLGYCLALRGRPTAAMEAFQAVIDASPESSHAQRALGLTSSLLRLYVPPSRGRPRFSRDQAFALQNDIPQKPIAIAIEPTAWENGAGELLWVADAGRDLAIAFDLSGQRTAEIPAQRARDINAGPFGRLWVVADAIVRPKDGRPTTLKVAELKAKGKGDQQDDRTVPLSNLVTAAEDGRGGVLVIDSDYDLPQQLNSELAHLGPLASASDRTPADLAVDHTGRIYLLQARKGFALSRYATDGRYLDGIPFAGTGYELKSPERVALGQLGELAILDQRGRQILLFDRDLKFIHKIDLTKDADVKRPIDIAVDFAGRIYVLDKSSNAVLRLQ